MVTTRQGILAITRKLMAERINYEERQDGKFAIKKKLYEKGKKLMLVSARYSLFTGLPAMQWECEEPTTIHELHEIRQDDEYEGTWMTNLPCELYQMWMELGRYARERV